MAAPTPVSSLVHSSTLVTAGVYVIIRYNLVFFQGVWIFLLVSFTVFLTGFVALMERDFKKLVAISTLSQLGVMFYALVVGFWKLAFLHIVVHALFKASLFLGVGLLMSICGGGQDYRSFGWG
jgi:NADH-ubiquinone oxidoreductase chain 5